MKRLDARVADLEAKHMPVQRVVRVRCHEGQSQEEAIIAAGYDPNDEGLFIIVRTLVSPRFKPDPSSS